MESTPEIVELVADVCGEKEEYHLHANGVTDIYLIAGGAIVEMGGGVKIRLTNIKKYISRPKVVESSNHSEYDVLDHMKKIDEHVLPIICATKES